MKRTGTINFVEYSTPAEPVEREFGQLQCDCCVARGKPAGVAFLPSDLPPDLAFGPELIGQRVSYDLDCASKTDGQPAARNIRSLAAAASVTCR